ncbi:hypothetical protein L9F63_028342, partial [Diploptera punctata]
TFSSDSCDHRTFPSVNYPSAWSNVTSLQYRRHIVVIISCFHDCQFFPFCRVKLYKQTDKVSVYQTIYITNGTSAPFSVILDIPLSADGTQTDCHSAGKGTNKGYEPAPPHRHYSTL